MGVVAPGFSHGQLREGRLGRRRRVQRRPLSRASFAAIPFAIWFFLAIEGVAMAAEEAKDPRRSIPIAYIAGILTLVALAARRDGASPAASGDWTQARQHQRPAAAGDEGRSSASNSGWLHMLVWLGLFGLIASFHGIIIGYSRQIFALARAGYLPRGRSAAMHPRLRTPHIAHPGRRRGRHRGDLQRRAGSRSAASR